MRCKDCKFWSLELELDDHEPWIGSCRRFPPTQKVDGEIVERDGRHFIYTSKFEIYTAYYEFCGEYKWDGETYRD